MSKIYKSIKFEVKKKVFFNIEKISFQNLFVFFKLLKTSKLKQNQSLKSGETDQSLD